MELGEYNEQNKLILSTSGLNNKLMIIFMAMSHIFCIIGLPINAYEANMHSTLNSVLGFTISWENKKTFDSLQNVLSSVD